MFNYQLIWMKPKNVLQIFQEQNGVNKVLSSELFFIFLQGILLSLGISIFEGHISESTILIVMCSTLQFSLVAHLCPILCSLMDCSTPGFPVHHQLPELAQTQIHWVSDAIQPSHPLSSPSPPALNLSQHQGLFQWVSSSHQVAKVLELQHQSFQWIFRFDFL